nr:ALBINO3-like protein 1, chloroplastic [Ipomoea batatas]
MGTFVLSLGPKIILSPFPCQTRTLAPIPTRTHFRNLPPHKPFLRGTLGVARFGLGQVPFPDPEDAEVVMKNLYARVEGALYTIADAAVSGSPDTVSAAATAETAKQNSDWLSGITNTMEAVLKVLKDGLSTLHVPYAYGFAIILLTVLVKAVTFPLTKKQVESAMAMRSLAPQIKAIQERYAGDQEKVQLETARLYKLAGINPLAGCLPTLATIPIWIGLYRALSNVANEGLLTEGFFWIPSLAGPTTIAARQTGSGTSWLFPFVDGHPPLGWSDTLAYLVLPVLLVISQYISIQIMQPPQSNDPNLKNSQAITKFLPLMIGYFSLSVPSGLSLYWLTNNILSTGQQVWLQKLGGAKNPMKELRDDTVRKEQPEVLNSLSEAPIAQKKDENVTSGGPRPGERFKQLKEEEARRRRQREEAKRIEEEAARRETNLTAGEDKEEASLVEREVTSRAVSHNGDSVSNSSNSTHSENCRVVNGETTSLKSKGDDQGSSEHYSRNDQHLDETMEKGEAVATEMIDKELSSKVQDNSHEH